MKRCTSTAFSWLLISLILAGTAHSDTAIPTDHLALPVQISLDQGGTASGFFMSSPRHEYFVTAKHVLFDPKSGRLKSPTAILLCWTKNAANAEKVKLQLYLARLLDDGRVANSKHGDVSLVHFGERLNRPGSEGIGTHTNYVQWLKQSDDQIQGANPSNTKAFEDVSVSNDIYLFGYPSSIGIQQMPQLDYERPLLRKGIVAGKNPALHTIIVDCPSYYGNSGGPVVQVERHGIGKTEFKVIGIVSQFVPFKETWVNTTHKISHWEISNSGYTIVTPVDVIMELIKEHEQAEQAP